MNGKISPVRNGKTQNHPYNIRASGLHVVDFRKLVKSSCRLIIKSQMKKSVRIRQSKLAHRSPTICCGPNKNLLITAYATIRRKRL